jgi:poly(3-hydroxybutyrate) depolymerase
MSCSIPVRRRSLFLLLGALWLTRRADASPDTLLAIRVDTAQRRALLHLPPAASAGRRLPLVIAFHGAEGTGQGLRNGTGFNDVADMRGVLVAYPDAPLGNWAEDCGCNNADRLGANDTGFVRALVDSVARITPLDRQRIYAVGFSQGALFTMRLECQLAEQFAASRVWPARCPPRCRSVAGRCDRSRRRGWWARTTRCFRMAGPGAGGVVSWARKRRFGYGSRSIVANRLRWRHARTKRE